MSISAAPFTLECGLHLAVHVDHDGARRRVCERARQCRRLVVVVVVDERRRIGERIGRLALCRRTGRHLRECRAHQSPGSQRGYARQQKLTHRTLLLRRRPPASGQTMNRAIEPAQSPMGISETVLHPGHISLDTHSVPDERNELGRTGCFSIRCDNVDGVHHRLHGTAHLMNNFTKNENSRVRSPPGPSNGEAWRTHGRREPSPASTVGCPSPGGDSVEGRAESKPSPIAAEYCP